MYRLLQTELSLDDALDLFEIGQVHASHAAADQRNNDRLTAEARRREGVG